MKIDYDAAHDFLNIEFLANVAIANSVEMDGVVIDDAKDKHIVAIEVLDAGKRTTRKPLDLTNLAIVKSTSAVGEGAETYGRRGKSKNVPSPVLREEDGLPVLAEKSNPAKHRLVRRPERHTAVERLERLGL